MPPVGDPLAIMPAITLDISLARRHPGKIDGELRLPIQFNQVEAALLTDHKQLLSTRARCRITEHERPHGELHRSGAGAEQERRRLAKGTDALSVVES